MVSNALKDRRCQQHGLVSLSTCVLNCVPPGRGIKDAVSFGALPSSQRSPNEPSNGQLLFLTYKLQVNGKVSILDKRKTCIDKRAVCFSEALL